MFFFFSSRRRHTRWPRDWSSDVCSSDLGVLKNAIDHASRPYGESVWKDKPAGILGVSIGAIGTALAQQHLRNMLAYLDVPTLGQPEAFIHANDTLFDGSGNIGPQSKEFLQGWMDQYVAWVKRHVD